MSPSPLGVVVGWKGSASVLRAHRHELTRESVAHSGLVM